jgi:hypothetical protein
MSLSFMKCGEPCCEKARMLESSFCVEHDERMRDAETGFHWRNGWFFKRMTGGSVRITRVTHPPVEGQFEWQFTIPENEWASIVCSVSEKGETSERWQDARNFHGRG